MEFIFAMETSFISQPSPVNQWSVCDLRGCYCNCFKESAESGDNCCARFVFRKQREYVRGKSDFLIVWIYVVVLSNTTAAQLTQDAIFYKMPFLQVIELRCTSAIWTGHFSINTHETKIPCSLVTLHWRRLFS